MASRYERVPPVQESSVHVGQAPPSTHASIADDGSAASFAKAPSAGTATTAHAAGTSGRTDRNRKFATVLGTRARADEAVVTTQPQAAHAASFFGHSSTTVAAGGGRERARPTMAAQAPHRLLVSERPGADRAWLRIEGGRFAGTEIHLSLNGPRLEVCVLTPHEASRETLAIAMEAARNRLRGRGLTMVEASSGYPARQTGAGTGKPSAATDAGGDEHGRPTS